MPKYKKLLITSSLVKKAKNPVEKLTSQSFYSGKKYIISSSLKEDSSSLSNFDLKKKTIIPYRIKNTGEDLSSSSLSLAKTNISFFHSKKENYNAFLNLHKNKNLNYNITSIQKSYKNNNIKNNSYKNDYFKFSFDNSIMDCLRNNHRYKHNKEIISNFVENSRLVRKAKIISHYCKNNSINLQNQISSEIVHYDNIKYSLKESEKLFNLFNKSLNHMVIKLIDTKNEEDYKLSIMKMDIIKLIKDIRTLYERIKHNINVLEKLKGLKKFLFEVKLDMYYELIPNEKKEEYGFITKTQNKKNVQTSRRFSIGKNFMKSRLFTSLLKKPIKKINSLENKKSIVNNINREITINKPIFQSEEEFMDRMRAKYNKFIDNFIIIQKNREKTREFNNILSSESSYYHKNIDNFNREENYLSNKLIILKQHNEKLNKKFMENKVGDTIKNSIIIVFMKLKNMIIDINRKFGIKNKAKIIWNEIINSKKNKIKKNEVITYIQYILKLVERTLYELFDIRNSIISDKNKIEKYNIICKEIEKEKYEIRIKFRNTIKIKKLKERAKKIIERIQKIRTNAILENRKSYSGDKIYEKKTLKKKLFKTND